MKIAYSRLQQIIKEETESLRAERTDAGLAIASESQDEAAASDMFGEPDEEGGMAKSQLLKISQYGEKIRDMLENSDQLPAWIQSKITKCAAMMGDVKHFLEGEFANQSDEMAPQEPEDDMSMQTELDELETIVSEELQTVLEKKKKKANPWAVCTTSVGREDKDKYERCVMDVKKQQGIE